jgi:hypothetical protein
MDKTFVFQRKTLADNTRVFVFRKSARYLFGDYYDCLLCGVPRLIGKDLSLHVLGKRHCRRLAPNYVVTAKRFWAPMSKRQPYKIEMFEKIHF